MPLPPEPDLSPHLQSLNSMGRPYSFLQECMSFLQECMSELGDSFTIDLKQHGKYALFAHPEAVTDILSAPPDILVASRGNRILRPLLGNRSLLLLDGEPHRLLLDEDPDRFAPQRFLEEKYSATEYLPFGGSHRRCIGANLAIYEMKLVLATIFRRMELVLAEEPPIRPVRRLVTLSPDSGTQVALRGESASLIAARRRSRIANIQFLPVSSRS